MPKRPYNKGISNPMAIMQTIEFIEKLVYNKDEFTVFEIGIGKGVYGYILKAIYGNKVELRGVDIENAGGVFDLCRSRIYNQVSKTNVLEWILPKEKFDIVLGTHVFEHMPENEAYKCIRKLKRVADNIVLAFPTPKKGHVYKGTDAHSHRWGYSEEKLEKMFFDRVYTVTRDNVFLWTEGQLPISSKAGKCLQRVQPMRRKGFFYDEI